MEPFVFAGFLFRQGAARDRMTPSISRHFADAARRRTQRLDDAATQ